LRYWFRTQDVRQPPLRLGASRAFADRGPRGPDGRNYRHRRLRAGPGGESSSVI